MPVSRSDIKWPLGTIGGKPVLSYWYVSYDNNNNNRSSRLEALILDDSPKKEINEIAVEEALLGRRDRNESR